MSSHDDACLVVVVAELGRRAILLFAEDTVEVAQVVESAVVAYLGNAFRGVDEQSAGIAQSHLDDVLAEVAARMKLEEAAERRGAHAGDVSQLGEADLIAVVGVSR